MACSIHTTLLDFKVYTARESCFKPKELTFVRINRGSGEKMEREGHIPNPNLAVAAIIELMVSWSVDHGCVVPPTSGLCSPYQIHSALMQLTINVVHISKSIFHIVVAVQDCRLLFQLNPHELRTTL